MSSPKEKAKELVNKFRKHAMYWDCYHDEPLEENHAKLCALICVDEIIEQWEYIDTYLADGKGGLNPNLKYWQEVKQVLENL